MEGYRLVRNGRNIRDHNGDLIMKNAIRLQGIGWGPATPTEQIKPGDRLMWNYGYVSVVLAVEKASEKYLNFHLKEEDGKEYIRRMKIGRLVARM